MVRRISICLVVLVVVILTGCGADTGNGSSSTGVKVFIDVNNIKRVDMWDYGGPYQGQDGFMVPVVVTPTHIPTAYTLYVVALTSRDGYQHGSDYAGWDKGEAPTPKTLQFLIRPGTNDASRTYDQLEADYKAKNFVTLSEDASLMLRTSIERIH